MQKEASRAGRALWPGACHEGASESSRLVTIGYGLWTPADFDRENILVTSRFYESFIQDLPAGSLREPAIQPGKPESQGWRMPTQTAALRNLHLHLCHENSKGFSRARREHETC